MVVPFCPCPEGTEGFEPRRTTVDQQDISRRRFMREGIATGTALGLLAPGLAAEGLHRVIGSNERVRIGQIGCGGRNSWHTTWVKNVSEQGNAAVVACCDIWRQKREWFSAQIEKRFGPPKVFSDYRKLLEDRDIDAVIIATPDHQHCGQLSDAVRAGKDVYIEKPVAMAMDELNRAYDVVKESGAVVQNGTQGRSSAGTAAMRALFRSGSLGRLFRVESTESAYIPYWNFYGKPEKESDTDWKAFLHGRPDRPFDPDQHGSWMGYHDFSSGPIGGWMSHFIDYVHAVTGCGFPRTCVAHGGIYAPTTDRRRTTPDTVTVVLEYAEGFVTHFQTHFGSSVDHETTTFLFEKGTARSLFGHEPGVPTVSGAGS